MISMTNEMVAQEVLLDFSDTHLAPPRSKGRYVPSPTLSYYANFIPPTPVTSQVPRELSHRPSTTSRSGVQQRDSTPRTQSSSTIKRKKSPPPPLDIQRATIEGDKMHLANRPLPKLVVLESPSENDSASTNQTQPVRTHRNLFGKSRKKPHPESHSRQTAQTDDSPDWTEIEHGVRHPSWMGGKEVRTDLLRALHRAPSQTSLSSNSTEQYAARHNTSPSTSSASPDTGGALHNILLTPTFGNQSTSRRRTPSLQTSGHDNDSSTALVSPSKVHGNVTYEKRSREASAYRPVSLLGRAGRILNDQRTRALFKHDSKPGTSDWGSKPSKHIYRDVDDPYSYNVPGHQKVDSYPLKHIHTTDRHTRTPDNHVFERSSPVRSNKFWSFVTWGRVRKGLWSRSDSSTITKEDVQSRNRRKKYVSRSV